MVTSPEKLDEIKESNRSIEDIENELRIWKMQENEILEAMKVEQKKA
ncbi:MAG: hypothetical protein HYW77_02035 [Parcubacteria group bacterium]|nr:hypothetical protein [Parcubacteria group bacterium]